MVLWLACAPRGVAFDGRPFSAAAPPDPCGSVFDWAAALGGPEFVDGCSETPLGDACYESIPLPGGARYIEDDAPQHRDMTLFLPGVSVDAAWYLGRACVWEDLRWRNRPLASAPLTHLADCPRCEGKIVVSDKGFLFEYSWDMTRHVSVTADEDGVSILQGFHW